MRGHTLASFTPQEIEQFLQQFFDVVGARQYVGARYVPIFGRAGEGTVEWDDTAPYEPLTVVMHEGVSYVSRRYVPAGIDIADTAYWAQTYRFNAQVEQYRQEVLAFQGQIDEIREDFVPFPDSLVLPKYGTLGQVLTTLANGETKWEDPVVPSDAQAEAVITEWLDEHPEATTTVEDGSITNAKMNANSFYGTDFMPRTWPTNETQMSNVTTSGIYGISSAAMSIITDTPNGWASSTAGLLVFQGFYNGNYALQVLMPSGGVNPFFYYRVIISTTGATYRDWKYIPTLEDLAPLFAPRSTPATTTTLASLLAQGVYNINAAVYAQLTDLPNTGENTNTATLLVYTNALNGNYVMQVFVSRHGKVYQRYISTGGSPLYDWKEVGGSAGKDDILAGKKWAFCGDSFTNGSFTDYAGSDTTIAEPGPYQGYASVYGYIVANRCGMVAQKVAANGETLSIGANSNIVNAFTNPSGANNFTMIDSDVDYITIYYGINDSHRRESETEPIAIGTINDEDATTFYGAWNVALGYLITNHPQAKIGIIVSNGCETDDYRVATIAAANKWGIPYIDLNGDERTPMMLRSTNQNVTAEAKAARLAAWRVSSTNTHPNPAAHRYESTFIEHFLRSL